MKKFILCKICLVVFVVLFAAESVVAGNWNKNSDSKRVDDDQFTQIDKAGKGIQWRLRPTSLISRAEQIIFVPDPLGSDDQVIQFEVSDGDCGENKQPDGSKWSDCDGGKDRAEINNRLPERGEVWYRWEIFFPKDYLSIFPAKNIHSQYKLISEKNKKKNSRKYLFFEEINYGLFFRGQKLVDDVRGKWTEIQVHANWTTEKTGFLRIYANGELKFRNDGYATLRPGYDAVRTHHGIYRIDLYRYLKSRSLKIAPKQTVLYKNFSISRTEPN